jgi:hypothetical protein
MAFNLQNLIIGSCAKPSNFISMRELLPLISNLLLECGGMTLIP